VGGGAGVAGTGPRVFATVIAGFDPATGGSTVGGLPN